MQEAALLNMQAAQAMAAAGLGGGGGGGAVQALDVIPFGGVVVAVGWTSARLMYLAQRSGSSLASTSLTLFSKHQAT